MPKQKTHSGTKDRIKLTKNGKALRRRSFGNHLLSKKSSSRKRRISSIENVTGKVLKSIKVNLGA